MSEAKRNENISLMQPSESDLPRFAVPFFLLRVG